MFFDSYEICFFLECLSVHFFDVVRFGIIFRHYFFLVLFFGIIFLRNEMWVWQVKIMSCLFRPIVLRLSQKWTVITWPKLHTAWTSKGRVHVVSGLFPEWGSYSLGSLLGILWDFINKFSWEGRSYFCPPSPPYPPTLCASMHVTKSVDVVG